MIHGFNVNLCEAGCAYDIFMRSLNLFWRARAVSLYWPGDAAMQPSHVTERVNIVSKTWSVLSYPSQIQRARKAAEILADAVSIAIRARRTGARALEPLEIIIVAHSLGCRLTLEFLKLMRPSTTQQIISFPLVILMAAAVPRYLVRRGEDLAKALDTPNKVLIYKSRADNVLLATFRSGQLLERPFPMGWSLAARDAIGLGGCGPNISHKVREIPGSRAHSEYWNDPGIASRLIEEIDGLRVAESLSRPLELRQLSSGRTILFRTIEGRKLNPRPPEQRGLRRVCGSC
jgi:hypothetical protein